MKQFSITLNGRDAGDLVELMLTLSVSIAASSEAINAMPVYGRITLALDARTPLPHDDAAILQRIS